MRNTIDMEYEYILSFVCDHLCKYPDTCSDQEKLARACDGCVLIDYLEDLEGNEMDREDAD